MAASALTVTVREDDGTGSIRVIIGNLAVAAGDYVVNGLDFATALLAAIVGQTSKDSILAVIFTGIGGNVFAYVPSTGKVKISDATHTELLAAATPVGVVNDVITFVAFCAKYQ